MNKEQFIDTLRRALYGKIDDYTPVSYTHLDVYKRQLQRPSFDVKTVDFRYL